MRHFLIPFILSVSMAWSSAAGSSDDTCLMFAARNLAKGSGNFYIYTTFSTQQIDLRRGDRLDYDVFIDKTSPQSLGGIDIDVQGNQSLRDSKAVDQNQIRAHGDGDLSRASGKWYHRTIPLDAIAGHKTERFNVVFEGDKEGRYVQFIDNVIITRVDGSKVAIYENGEPQAKRIQSRDGYSQHVLLTSAPRAEIKDGADLSKFVESRTELWNRQQRLESIREEVETAAIVAKRSNNEHLQSHVDEARAAIAKLESTPEVTEEQFQAVLHQVNGALNHEHPEMRKYTGHLVGHAHIDFQWLWEWPETIQVCHDTFGQAVKFMAEFPQFTFSQSSAALYAATEDKFPDLFKEMQKYVAKGQWEIVGGRICEGDEHMISPESHAMHFLYGQRYFRERFNGKSAIVGWEPDTFGHTWTFPQILKLGGCKYFYFCRGGHGKPMFWWEGPDGTRILSFEEPATGGWYNGDVKMNRFERLFHFEDVVGAKDMLWVYGVGNHGGGPTRENIEAALEWMKKPYLPAVKFSTATEFFQILEKNYDMNNLPVVRDEMNTTNNAGFYGTYTTHSDIKRWNRDAEAITESAETVAAIAAQFGFKYPKSEFRKNWEDICWNHHHDTLPGTSIHPSYNLSEKMYTRVIESSRKIAADALNQLAMRVKGDGEAVVVFNPCSWARDGRVEIDGEYLFAIAPDNTSFRLQRDGSRWFFVASDVPPLGYRRYRLSNAAMSTQSLVSAEENGSIIQNQDYRLTIDANRGVVTSIFDRNLNRETLASNGSGNRLEIHWENPNGMSAWSIGKIERVEPLLGPVKIEVVERGPVRVMVRWIRQFQSTTLVQTVSMTGHGPPEFGLSTDWRELGDGKNIAPFLKVAFDVNLENTARLTSQIPFGDIEHAADNTERPALKFADLSDGDNGAAIINDCKHGYSAEGRTIRLSLIRSSSGPDAHPNDRPQSARWSFMPHKGSWRDAGVLQTAEAFNHPLLAAVTALNASGKLEPEGSFVTLGAPDVFCTAMKIAEDSDDLVIRFFEAMGRPAQFRIDSKFAVKHTHVVNFVEDELGHENVDSITLRPYEIKTLSLVLGGLK